MRRSILFFTLTLALCIVALPAVAQEAAQTGDDAACVNMTPANAQTMIGAEAPVESLETALEASVEPGDQAGCSGWARCADGSIVTCTGQWSCWGIDDCYAYCDGSYKWCNYRPHPCPI